VALTSGLTSRASAYWGFDGSTPVSLNLSVYWPDPSAVVVGASSPLTFPITLLRGLGQSQFQGSCPLVAAGGTYVLSVVLQDAGDNNWVGSAFVGGTPTVDYPAGTAVGTGVALMRGVPRVENTVPPTTRASTTQPDSLDSGVPVCWLDLPNLGLASPGSLVSAFSATGTYVASFSLLDAAYDPWRLDNCLVPLISGFFVALLLDFSFLAPYGIMLRAFRGRKGSLEDTLGEV